MEDGHSQQQQSTGQAQSPQQPEPPHKSHRHKPTDQELNSARMFIRLFVFAIILTLLTSYLELPWKAVAPVFGIASIVFGIIGLVKAVRCGFRRLLRISMALGLGAALVLTVSTATLVALWPVTAEYETCMSQALTVRAENGCVQNYQDTLKELSEPLTE